MRRWRHAWAESGPRSLRSQGPASLPRLSDQQFAQLEAELAEGPAAHGWEDQRRTLNRVKTVIGRRFHLTYTIQGVRKLLVRNGWSCQVPARRAMERDDDAVAGWVKEVWPRAEGQRRARGAWLVFEDEAGFSMTPPHAKTWSPLGPTPVVRVRGRSRRRISIAALTCYHPATDPG